MALTKMKGVIFDLDGVITGTARVHALAWESMFNDFLKKNAKKENIPFVPFDSDYDYLQYVDGKPRPEGVKSFLESRGIELSFGELDDPPDSDTICGMGNRKNLDFQKMLRREGPDVFESSVKFVKCLKKKGIKVGVASSSRNCRLILQLAGIEDLFETRVDGEVSCELNLKGKPDPDIFVTAARNLGLMPGECMVVEDAISGVKAGRNGNFGLTLGIARSIDGEILCCNGADMVVRDLGEISIKDIENWFKYGIDEHGWNLTYHDFYPEKEKLRETLCTVGNGYLGIRGCFEGESASEVHYPGTYIAGVYNRLGTKIHNKTIYNNDFVNCPNLLLIEFRVGTGDFLSPLKMELLSYTQTLSLRDGVLERSFIFNDGLGRITSIRSKRLASMADPHICAVKYEITPVNYSEIITLRSSIDGNVINDGVERYRQLNSKHLSLVAHGESRDGIFLHVQTNRSKCQIFMNARTVIYQNGKKLRIAKGLSKKKARISEEIKIEVRPNTTYAVEKYVSVYTSLDRGISNPKKAAQDAVSQIKSFKKIYLVHAKTWESLWDRADIRISGDRFLQKTTRLHIYHLLVTASPHNIVIDAGMPARGLHGEAYRGHIFWDELYILPFYNIRFPEITRALLMYRYNRLNDAKRYAAQNSYKGAMYPWQTADSGVEETQEVHFNPKDGSWGPDLSRLQRHVSIAVFHNVWKYVSDTGDRKFLEDYGAEIMLEIARFWASVATYDADTEKYHIKGVMGPDEFHEQLPGAAEHGLKDNAYTNVMVVWLLEKSLELIESLPKKTLVRLKGKVGFRAGEIKRWQEIADNMNIVMLDGKIISQFDGYKVLKELDWDYYRNKYGDIHRLDRILKAEGNSPDLYKVTKQADTLMMFYVLAPGEVQRILKHLGYKVDDAIQLLRDNYRYYEKRTSHGSTLMKSDIFDTQGGTTIEGIHSGVMAGSLDIIMRCFAGINLSGIMPELNPHMPGHWNMLAFRILHRNIWYDLEIMQKSVKVKVSGKVKKPVLIKVYGKGIRLTPGKKRTVKK
ncbi:MAG: beta-phosphoglucomutase family hydrolase [Deltaproteobacteria bacterium]|nr:beta-phosphoglucomutase family hydrolase [Deltaproteobacteria bacterium]